MGQYTVYCNDNANFKNVANGTGELRIQDTSMRADGVIYFDKVDLPEPEGPTKAVTLPAFAVKEIP